MRFGMSPTGCTATAERVCLSTIMYHFKPCQTLIKNIYDDYPKLSIVY